MKRAVAALIQFYRAGVSPLLGPSCRFHPTCSHYAEESILTHGLAQGTWLTIKRILRCHRWNPGGYDPVPSSHDRR